MSGRTFVMAGGGTAGHVMPALAVARDLRRRGHEAVFVGTRRGFEAKLVPAAGFTIEWIEIGGLMRVGWRQTLKTAIQLPAGVARAGGFLRRRRAAAVFSMGGYAAGPVMLAAWMRSVPMVLMEPNAMPGMTNRRMGRVVKRALISFEETAGYFPPGKTEITGLPVREEFFAAPERPREEKLHVLITGGSRGSRTLNNAFRRIWEPWKSSRLPLRVVHQCGQDAAEELRREFAATGLEGEVTAFIDDMPRAFAEADLVVSRSGAGAVAELAAAGRPAILVPFPFASEQHQLRNAEAMRRAGAATLVTDEELTGERLFREIREACEQRERLASMGRAARRLAKPDAAARAADILERVAGGC